MTHDEIAQLDAAGLRLEVARVKGIPVSWYEVKVDGYDKWEKAPFNGVTRDPLPDWPADIRAAWELAEEFPEWSAGKYPSGYRFIGWDYRDGELYQAAEEYGQSIEIAICRAYLMWKQT